jgi:hypothetical protein
MNFENMDKIQERAAIYLAERMGNIAGGFDKLPADVRRSMIAEAESALLRACLCAVSEMINSQIALESDVSHPGEESSKLPEPRDDGRYGAHTSPDGEIELVPPRPK